MCLLLFTSFSLLLSSFLSKISFLSSISSFSFSSCNSAFFFFSTHFSFCLISLFIQGHYRPAERHLRCLLAYFDVHRVNLIDVEVDVQRVMKIARQTDKGTFAYRTVQYSKANVPLSVCLAIFITLWTSTSTSIRFTRCMSKYASKHLKCLSAGR